MFAVRVTIVGRFRLQSLFINIIFVVVAVESIENMPQSPRFRRRTSQQYFRNHERSSKQTNKAFKIKNQKNWEHGEKRAKKQNKLCWARGSELRQIDRETNTKQMTEKM